MIALYEILSLSKKAMNEVDNLMVTPQTINIRVYVETIHAKIVEALRVIEAEENKLDSTPVKVTPQNPSLTVDKDGEA